MLSKDGTVFKSLLILLFLSIGSVAASGWYQVYEDALQPNIKAAVYGDNGIDDLYAVGDAGRYYQLRHYGNEWGWDTLTISNDNLSSIATARDWNNNGIQVHVAAGENGAVLYYDSGMNQWFSHDSLGNETYNKVYYDQNTSRFWVGGDKGQLYYSQDYGRNWTIKSFDVSYNIMGFTSSYNWLFVFAEKNDTTFVLRESMNSGTFYSAPGDTLPNIKFIDSATPYGGGNGSTYILGLEFGIPNTHLWEFSLYSQDTPPTELYSGDMGIVTGIGAWSPGEGGTIRTTKTEDAMVVLWVSVQGGGIWESSDLAATWSFIYSDSEGRDLNCILAGNPDKLDGRAFGSGGIVIKYGFEIRSGFPGPNDIVSSNLQKIELGFSLVPDLGSIQAGVRVLSDQRGVVPYNAVYSDGDSTIINLVLDDLPGTFQIPGEKFNITLGDTLHEKKGPLWEPFPALNYDVTLVSPMGTSFQFNHLYHAEPLNQMTTNWVTGFINEDDNLDLLTFGADTIFCFAGADTGNYDNLQKIPMAGVISVDINIPEQLILTDINNDGLPDILLYSSSRIFILINSSTGQQVNFNIPSAQLTEESIKKIVAYNNNSNTKTDLLIMGSSFYTLLDINETSFGTNTITHEYNPVSFIDVAMTDIDADGRQDMIILDSDHMMQLRRGQPDWNNQTWYDSYNSVWPSNGRGYEHIKTSDFDNDHRQEIIAFSAPYQQSSYLDLIYMSGEMPGDWQFSTLQDFIYLNHAPILDVYIQDFGGIRNEEFKANADLTVLSQDSLFFFENETNYPGEYQMIGLPQYTKPVGSPYNFLLAGDFDKDAALDFAAYGVNAGQFDMWHKFMWKPVIENTWIGDHQINLAWTPFPSEAGTLEYYNIARDTTPQFDHQRTYIRQTYQSNFIDYEVGDYDSFWYTVQAVYNNGSESEWSEPVNLQTYFELNGPQAGVLADTTRPYLAVTSISVESGASLEIHPGIHIGFRPGTRFDVWGNLQVMGSDVENYMVDLQSTWQDSSAYTWDGIYLHPAADTVRFNWFSVAGSKNGITVDNRPLKLRFGGIMHNETGMQVSGDSVNIQNVVFDSNGVALHVYGGTRAEVKNVLIIHSQLNSIVAEGASKTTVRNAIIWGNLGPVTKENAVTQMRVKYSTVDSMKKTILYTEISRLAPLFMPPDSGEFRIDYMSPTIDAGDPADDFSEEPAPNGGRINQGLFGGSFMATLSLQPRVKIKPLALFMKIRPLHSDTANFIIHNPGGSALDVSRIELQSEGGVFQLLNNSGRSIPPGDSSIVPVMFTPPEAGDYIDTIRVYCNDPHLKYGFVASGLLGRGSDEVPIIRMDPLLQHILHETVVRFWYSVADSGSTTDIPAQEGTYIAHYELRHLVAGDTSIRSGSAVAGDHFDFTDLDDGLYVMKMWANSYPGTGNEENHVKRQFFSVGVKKKTAYRLRWYLVSIPRSYSVDWNWFALEDTLAYLLKWDNAEEKYIPLDIENVQPGQAFWTFPFKKMEIDLARLDSVQYPAKSTGYAPLHALEAGWNQIGIPQDYRVFWHQMRFYTEGGEYDFLQAVQDSLIDGVVYNFKQNSDFQGYDWSIVDSTSRAEPWVGYWLRANRPCEVEFPEEPAFESRYSAIAVADSNGVQKPMAAEYEIGWKLNLSLRNKHYADIKNIIGVGSVAPVRVMEPPHIGDFCAVFMSSEKGNITQKIYSGFKSEEDVKTWDLQVVSHEANLPHTFSWDNSQLNRANVYLYLVDEKSETIINMNDQNNYVFTPGASKTTFKVFATESKTFTPELIPLTFKMEQNYPNPFNPQTTIRFGIPAEANGKKIALVVYDILGKKVAEIYKGNLKSGYHKFVWNGRNMKGNKTASGVYFYRLQTSGKQIVKKMVLVR